MREEQHRAGWVTITELWAGNNSGCQGTIRCGALSGPGLEGAVEGVTARERKHQGIVRETRELVRGLGQSGEAFMLPGPSPKESCFLLRAKLGPGV